MPDKKPGESRSAFVARCVPVAMKEGLTQEQAVGKCEGMYTSQSRKEASMEGMGKKDRDMVGIDKKVICARIAGATIIAKALTEKEPAKPESRFSEVEPTD